MAQNQPSTENSQEVERIRDIIFGSQMRDYEQRFQIFQRDVKRLQQEIDRLTEQLAEQSSEQNKRTQQLRVEVRQSDDDLRDELRLTAQQLTTDKVDRVKLAELFIDLGNQLKSGSSVTELLTKLEGQA